MSRPTNPGYTPQQLWDAWNRLWNGDYAIADDYVSRTMRVNIPEFGMPDPTTLSDGPQVASWIAAFRSSYEDDAAITGELGPFFVGDYAIGRWVFRGTWRGGRPATATVRPGTDVAFRGVDILRFEDGRIAEYWLTDDQLDLYAQLGAVAGATVEGEGEHGAAADLPRRLAGLDPQAGRALLLDRTLELTAELLDKDEVRAADSTTTFLALGIESLTAVGLRDCLQEETGLSLPATLVFGFPTPQALADHMWSRLSASSSDGAQDPFEALAVLEDVAPTFGGPDGEPLRAELADRLSALARQLTPAAGPDADELEAASAHELLAYLDNKLGPAEQPG